MLKLSISRMLAASMTTAAVVASVCSCNKNLGPDLPGGGNGNGAEQCIPAHITISATGGLTTRATGTDPENEQLISDLQVLVFREDGSLDAYARESGGTLEIDCTQGPRHIVAVTNYDSLSEVSTLSQLMSIRTSLVDNALDNFIMIGEKTTDVYTGAEIEIPVARLVSRIRISSIKTDFTSDAYKEKDFVIEKIYLVNAPSDVQFGYFASENALSWSSEVWLNRMRNTSDLPTFLLDSGIDATLQNKQTYSTVHDFYCYPNPTSEDSSSATWSPRFTRLVVEATLDGVKYYYPVSIPAIANNRTYTITSLTITRPGSTSADIPVTTAQCTVSASVDGWEEGSSNGEQI